MCTGMGYQKAHSFGIISDADEKSVLRRILDSSKQRSFRRGELCQVEADERFSSCGADNVARQWVRGEGIGTTRSAQRCGGFSLPRQLDGEPLTRSLTRPSGRRCCSSAVLHSDQIWRGGRVLWVTWLARGGSAREGRRRC